ncbi:alpha-1,3-mannosyl-glycoprotein 4-beta-N-acetylglucosaminyltransferase C-like [Argopecten irradians]|uniref:alpha-1,3-mannosyl-glycoprotein 4-beta-N-acetylglucosaminyltransferase C-like n=1 Tax=Argopecten irradians TaxID=31199 RepID=UPI0037174A34
MKIRLIPRRVYIPSVVFILCIVIQLRILFVVPSDKELKTCSERHAIGRKAQKAVKEVNTDSIKITGVYDAWQSEFNNPLIGVKLTKNVTTFLRNGLDLVRNSSLSYKFSLEVKPRLISVALLVSEVSQMDKTFKTMDTLLEDNAGEERKRFLIILQLSMRDADLGTKVFNESMKRYADFYETGQVHIVLGPSDLYKKFGIPKETDADMRKEILDYALLFLYSKHLSSYFVQLEPGIVCEKYLVRNILKLANAQKSLWFGLDFGHFGFIGTLFHSTFLQSMAEYLASRYLIENINVLLRQLYQIISKRCLIYTNSSPCLHHDIDRLKSRFLFERGDNFDYLKGDNPSATIETSMSMFEEHSPEQAYDNDNSTFFWASSLKFGDNFRLRFNTTVNISRVVIVTGSDVGNKDRLISGYLRVGSSNPPCATLIRRGVFVRGYVDTIEQGINDFPPDINCLSIDVTRQQRQWLVLRDIKVFVRKPNT